MTVGSSIARGRRVEYRPRVRDNLYAMALFTGVGAVLIAFAVIAGLTGAGPWLIVGMALLVLVLAGLPWAYVLTATLWLEDESVGADRLFFLHSQAPRDRVRRVVGGMSKIFIVGPDDRLLFSVSRFWSDDQIRALAAELGLKVEGSERYLGGPL